MQNRILEYPSPTLPKKILIVTEFKLGEIHFKFQKIYFYTYIYIYSSN